jgi:hypothetical protein
MTWLVIQQDVVRLQNRKKGQPPALEAITSVVWLDAVRLQRLKNVLTIQPQKEKPGQRQRRPNA